MARRWIDPETAGDIGRLDAQAIARVRSEAWPDPANADELHDSLAWLGFLAADEAADWGEWLEALARENRVTRLRDRGADVWIATERLSQFQALWPEARPDDVDRPARWPSLVPRGRAGRNPARTAGGPGAGLAGRLGGSARVGGERDRRRAGGAAEPKASPCAGGSPRAPMPRSGATGGCSRAFTTTRSSVCAPRSSRSPRATSCVSCSPGSM